MAANKTSPFAPAAADLRTAGEVLIVRLTGRWRITTRWPTWPSVIGNAKASQVKVEVAVDGRWDSALVVFVTEIAAWCIESGAHFDRTGLPPAVTELMAQLEHARETSFAQDRSKSFLVTVGEATVDVWAKLMEIMQFVGECTLSAGKLLRLPHRFRWRDCLAEMQQCGAMALPIVGLISLLVGLILGYQAAVLLRQFGGDIYVADLVGVSVIREMGPLMAAIIVAGRTGAAFAAQLGNMKANEEIDALVTLGLQPVDFLVMPRIAALAVMMPLLAMYGNLLGILGGMFVAFQVLEIPPTAFWVEMLTIVDLSDLVSGLIKAATFGMLIGLSGCLRGLQAERSAVGVGRATTSAVVTAIVLIVSFDAVFAVVFNILGI